MQTYPPFYLILTDMCNKLNSHPAVQIWFEFTSKNAVFRLFLKSGPLLFTCIVPRHRWTHNVAVLNDMSNCFRYKTVISLQLPDTSYKTKRHSCNPEPTASLKSLLHAGKATRQHEDRLVTTHGLFDWQQFHSKWTVTETAQHRTMSARTKGKACIVLLFEGLFSGFEAQNSEERDVFFFATHSRLQAFQAS